MGRNTSKHKSQSDKSTPSEVVSLIVSILALGLSIWSVFATNQNSKDLLEYQISEERLPIVTGLNCEIPIQSPRAEDGILNQGSLPETIYPLKIAFYNIGTGMAQNCKIEWDAESIQSACSQIIDLLEKNSSVKIKTFSYKQLELSSWNFYDYIINIEDNIEKIMYWNGSNHVAEYLDLQTVRSPYLQPLLSNNSNLTISLPAGLSLLLFEMANQGIEASVSTKIAVSYQDIIGKEFLYSYAVTFVPTIEIDNDDSAIGYIYVTFQELDTTQ